MARRDLGESFCLEDKFQNFQETFLPSFPNEKRIGAVLPELIPKFGHLNKAGFLAWLDFALEYPDEIWEANEFTESQFYYYLNFISEKGKVPVFVVEVFSNDEVLQVNNFSLIISKSDLDNIRNGELIYSSEKEWEKERLVRFLNEQALLKYDEDKLDEAKELIDAAISLSGKRNAYLFNNRGLIWWKMGRIEEAKEDFRESINLDRTNGDPYFNIGLIYFDESDYHRALYYLRRAVELNPLDPQFLAELGRLYLELEQEEQAIELFRRSFESDPSDPQIDFHLAHYFLYRKGKPRRAVKYYDIGLKKDPQDQFAWADLAVAHWVLGNKKKAQEIHARLEQSSRLMPYTISRLVYLKVEMGDYETALQYYKQAMNQKEPYEPEWLHYNAALIYARTGRPKQALDTLNLAIRVGGEAVIKRALSDKTLKKLKQTPDFKKLIKLSSRRRNR